MVPVSLLFLSFSRPPLNSVVWKVGLTWLIKVLITCVVRLLRIHLIHLHIRWVCSGVLAIKTGCPYPVDVLHDGFLFPNVSILICTKLLLIFCRLLIKRFWLAVGAHNLRFRVKIILGCFLLVLLFLVPRDGPPFIHVLNKAFLLLNIIILGNFIHLISGASVRNNFGIALPFTTFLRFLLVSSAAGTADKYENKRDDHNKGTQDSDSNFPANRQIWYIFEKISRSFCAFFFILLRICDILNNFCFWISLIPRSFDLIPDSFRILAQDSAWVCELQTRVIWVRSKQILSCFPHVSARGTFCRLESESSRCISLAISAQTRLFVKELIKWANGHLFGTTWLEVDQIIVSQSHIFDYWCVREANQVQAKFKNVIFSFARNSTQHQKNTPILDFSLYKNWINWTNWIKIATKKGYLHSGYDAIKIDHVQPVSLLVHNSNCYHISLRRVLTWNE